MNAATETAEITTETTAFQRSVLRAMLELAGSNTSNEIAKQAGVKSEPVRVCLARLRDAGLIGTEVNPDRGGPPLWHLRASVDTVRSMVAAPIPSANDGTPGDDEPAPEPGDTQAVDAAEAAPDPGGWIPWRGGECPVPEGVACWVRLRDGLADICHTPERLFWGRGIDEDNEDDIVAYRPEPKQTGPASLDDPDNFGDDEMPTAAPDPDGWIPWRGGECPVPVGSRCSIRLRNADVAHCIRDPEAWWWGRAAERTADLSDIIAYRPEPKQTGPASFDDPDDYGDDEIPPAAAYDATVEAEAKADEAPLAGEDVNSGEDVIGDWCERHADPAEAAAEQIAAAVAAGHCPTVGLLIQRASPVAEEAAQRAIDDAEAEAQAREKEADIALVMARDARARGIAVAEIIRFAEQRTGLAGDADPSAVLYAIDELLDQAREAVTGMRVA